MPKPPAGTPVISGHVLLPDVFAAPIWETEGGTITDIISSRVGTIGGGPTNCAWNVGVNNEPVFSFIGNQGSVNFGSPAFLPTLAGTVILGYKKRDSTNRSSGAWGTNGSPSQRFGAHFPWSDGTAYIDFGNTTNGEGRLAVSGQSFTDYAVWIFTFGSRGIELWKNNAEVGNGPWNTTITPGGDFTLGNYGGQDSDLVDIYFMWIYSTQLSEANIEIISSDPYIFFETEEEPPPQTGGLMQPKLDLSLGIKL